MMKLDLRGNSSWPEPLRSSGSGGSIPEPVNGLANPSASTKPCDSPSKSGSAWTHQLTIVHPETILPGKTELCWATSLLSPANFFANRQKFWGLGNAINELE